MRQEVVREASQAAQTSEDPPDQSGGPGVCGGLLRGVADHHGRERALAHVCAYPTAARKRTRPIVADSVAQLEVLNVAKRVGDERIG
jgi:hypothetical protein